MKLTIESASEAFLHEPDTFHPGTILEFEETPDTMGYGPGLKWVIQLDDDDPDDTVWAWTGQKITTGTKLGKWLIALGADIGTPGAVVDLEDYIGARVEVMFERTVGSASDGSTVEKEKVVKVKASKTKAPAKPKPAKAAPPHVDDDEAPF